MTSQPSDASGTLPLSAELRLDAACLRFEAAWKAGRRPRLEDFLTDCAGAERVALLRELIRLDVCYRRGLSETPRPEEYNACFPEVSVTRMAELISDAGGTPAPGPRAGNGPPSLSPLGPAGTEKPLLADSFKDYDQLELIGCGGMGVVYRARDVRLNRRVALKMIRGGEQTAALRQRFRTEAEVVARLHHPNVVQIYEVGEHQGHPFLALEFVEGGNLKEKLNGLPLPPPQAARLVETLARAVGAAHGRHIVHRDLKPANVLLTDDGVPKITDFGLAKRLDEAGQTQSRLILGTPSYMAPEQADGDQTEVGPAADVYALGAILYECLTGRAPFLAATTLDTLKQVREDEPVSPRRLQPRCPRNLETICLKCLHKGPHKRYARAEELADDLARFLRGEAVTARPVGRGERLWNWGKRHPAEALAGSLLVVLLVLGVLGVAASLEWRLAVGQRRQAEGARDALAAEQERTAAALAGAEAAQAEEQRQRRKAEAAEALVNRLHYFSDVQKAELAWLAGEIGPFRDMLDDLGKGRAGQADLPGFEYRYLNRQCRLRRTLAGHTLGIFCASWSPDGERLASSAFDSTVRIWDADSGEQVRLLQHPAMVKRVSWSPDGKRLASACSDSLVHVWDVGSGKEALSLKGVRAEKPANSLIWLRFDVYGVDWGPDGRRLAGATADSLVHVWDATTGKEILTIRGHTAAVSCVAWDRDGKRLATASDDGTVRLWDAGTGKELRRLKGHGGTVFSVRWSPDGRRLAGAASDRTVRVWNAEDGTEARAPLGHPDEVWAADWGPDGKRLATACSDQVVRVWEIDSGKEVLTLRGHTATVFDVSWHPDGRRLASASVDKSVRLWDVGPRPTDLALPSAYYVGCLAWSPDGRRLAAGSDGHGVVIWAADSGREPVRLAGRSNNVHALSWSPDGTRLALGYRDRLALVCDAGTGKELLALKGHTAPVLCVSWGPDGTRLATGCQDGTVRLWDASPGKGAVAAAGGASDIQPATVIPCGGAVSGVCWSPDGRRLAGACADRTLRVWDANSGKELLALKGHAAAISGVCWGPDGRRLASASADRTLRLWDADTGQEALRLTGHAMEVYAVCWSPDGRRLASTSDDKTVRVWDADTGKEALTLRGHEHGANCVAWSPDGQRLASASASETTVRVWVAGP